MGNHKYIVLGSGRQGQAAAYDLMRQGGDVRLVDHDKAALEKSCRRLGLSPESGVVADFKDEAALRPLFHEADGAVLSADYSLNTNLTGWAIEEKCCTVDYGGNHEVVAAQHALDVEAKAAGVAIVPDTGLTPGLAGVLVAGGIAALDDPKVARIRVGGLPQNPKPPLNYSLLFSVRGLTNEYLEPSVLLEDGKRIKRPSLTGLEEVEIDGTVYEAFYTSGGVSTLPESFGDVLKALDCKTLRYPGHAELIRFAFDIGFSSEEPISVGGVEIIPREVFEQMLVRSLPHDDPDVTLMRVTVIGVKDAVPARAVYEMIDYYDNDSGFTSMQRTTAWPGTIILGMVLNGEISERGVLFQERVVSPQRMVEELASRGIRIDFELKE